jgi:hypothetical protein
MNADERRLGGTEMKKYRVVLPIDLGDGEIHNFGEVLELELEVAVQYNHALIALDEREEN